MEFSTLFIPILIAVVAIGVVAVGMVARAWPRNSMSREERDELARAPMPPLQKRAWGSLVIGIVTLAATSAILLVEGAAAYWNDDDLRLIVLAIFVAGLFSYVAMLLVPLVKGKKEGTVDERDQLVLSKAPAAQSAGVFVALAIWLIVLPKMFREEGAVPIVYLYLMFGSVIIANIIAQSVGILFGYWFAARHGQG